MSTAAAKSRRAGIGHCRLAFAVFLVAISIRNPQSAIRNRRHAPAKAGG